jgi:hypothetical protein
MIVEQMYETGTVTEAERDKIKLLRRSTTHSLIEMFVKLKSRPSIPHEILEKYPNGFVPWPAAWTDRHYNGCNEPCDLLIGPCRCGAWHSEDETWVQEKLIEHQAVIV